MNRLYIIFTPLILLLSGCFFDFEPQVDPTQFYVLQALGGDKDVLDASEVDGVTLGVGRVKLPEYLDSQRIAVKTSGNQVVYEEFYRWAEPLGAAMNRVLVEDLMKKLATEKVYASPWRFPLKHEYALYVDVTDFVAESERNRVILVAHWEVQGQQSKEVLREGRSRITQSIEGWGANGMAGSMDEVIWRLSGEIAEALLVIKKEERATDVVTLSFQNGGEGGI